MRSSRPSITSCQRRSSSQARAGEVHLPDDAVTAQGQVADRRGLVQGGVAGERGLQLDACPPQLLVLHLQLDLVDLQLVQQALAILRRARHTVAIPGKLLLGLAAQLG